MSKRGMIVVAVLLILTAFSGCSIFNRLVSMNEAVGAAWSQVDNQYQRRFDLIPNLVETVKGYATHERGTLTDVTEARAKVGQVRLTADQLTPELLSKFQAAQGELSGALSRLMLVVERYPDLKADDLFRGLQDELAGTENRIATARRDFNLSAQRYNVAVKRVPSNLVAGVFHFAEKPYIQSDAEAKRAPRVNFGIGQFSTPGIVR